jgi:UDP-glucose 4-epimerase
LLALAKLDEKAELVYNLGNGKGYSVRQVIDCVRKVSGKEFKVVEVAPRPGDPPVLTADASKAKKELGWKTDYPELEKIVESAWTFHTAHPGGYVSK